jgi:ABC-2 type transport system ATP-binding protein
MGSIVKINNLNMSYGKTSALKNVNLELPANNFIGLLGPNGSGKTTLLKILAGLITYYTGEVRIDGQPVSTYTKSIVSYLPSSPYVNPRLTLEQLINTYASFFPTFSREKANYFFDYLHLAKNTMFSHLSKGLQEQVALSLALSKNSKLYLLDEPFGGIDVSTRDKITDMITTNYPNNSTFLIVTHEIHDMESLLNYVVLIKNGEILLAKSSDSIRSGNAQSIEDFYKEAFK